MNLVTSKAICPPSNVNAECSKGNVEAEPVH